ncbi:MAG: hypothetical protein Q4P65_03870 [Eubacteriales bacterium]|nr:hypothetical protein [Eubacteriales bacterium]
MRYLAFLDPAVRSWAIATAFLTLTVFLLLYFMAKSIKEHQEHIKKIINSESFQSKSSHVDYSILAKSELFQAILQSGLKLEDPAPAIYHLGSNLAQATEAQALELGRLAEPFFDYVSDALPRFYDLSESGASLNSRCENNFLEVDISAEKVCTDYPSATEAELAKLSKLKDLLRESRPDLRSQYFEADRDGKRHLLLRISEDK